MRRLPQKCIKKLFFESQARTGSIGFLSNIIENHDEPRGVSRFIPAEDLCDTSKKALARAYFFPERYSVYISGAGDRNGKLPF